jgi:hypothetical protein
LWGPTFPELVEALPGIEVIDRLSVNAFDEARVARAIEETGRKKLIFAGISLEACAAFKAMTAVGKGFDAYVAVDASGTFSETKRQVGLLRMLQAGVIVSDYATLMVGILKANARAEAGEVYGAIDMECQACRPDRPRVRKVNESTDPLSTWRYQRLQSAIGAAIPDFQWSRWPSCLVHGFRLFKRSTPLARQRACRFS